MAPRSGRCQASEQSRVASDEPGHRYPPGLTLQEAHISGSSRFPQYINGLRVWRSGRWSGNGRNQCFPCLRKDCQHRPVSWPPPIRKKMCASCRALTGGPDPDAVPRQVPRSSRGDDVRAGRRDDVRADRGMTMTWADAPTNSLIPECLINLMYRNIAKSYPIGYQLAPARVRATMKIELVSPAKRSDSDPLISAKHPFP
jgi:hypothetical protein